MRAIILLSTVATVTSFASPKGGWKERPAIPEIQQYTEPEAEASSSTDDKTPAKREPWDLVRFVKQSSKFVSLPTPFSTSSSTPSIKLMPQETIWQPNSSSNNNAVNFQWGPLDDVVMGGVSSSTFDNASGQWRGTVSDSNSGGFVGIRTTPFSNPLDVSDCQGIEFRLRAGSGNAAGKRFKAVIRDSKDFNGVCWTTSFDIPKMNPMMTLLGGGNKGDDPSKQSGGVVSIRIPFDKQVPTIFAKTVPDQTFDATNVAAFQLAYSKFEYDGNLNNNFSLGDFSLQIVEVKTY